MPVTLVVGASGDLGRRVVRHLAESGVEVRAGLRRPGRDGPLDSGVTAVRCDLLDAASLDAACAGVATVVATATAIARALSGGSDSIDAVDRAGMLALVDAAERSGVPRFVFCSYAGVDAGLGFPLERAKAAVEARLAQSPMRSCVVRPDAFQEVHLAPLGRFDVANGRVSVIGRGDNPHRWVATDDVARLLAAVAMDPDPPRLVEFGGTEAMSRNDAIAVAERLTGRTFRVQRMPLGLARIGMRLLARPKPAIASIFGTGIVLDTVPTTWDDGPLRRYGIEPTSAGDFIAAQAVSAG